MTSKEYKNLVSKHPAEEKRGLNMIISFVIGGLFGVAANFLVNFYSNVLNIPSSDASVFMITTLIFISCLLTALGVFDNFVKFAKMGVIIPITGFAHSMQSAALDSKSEGLIYGIGSNAFKLSGSVILYGVFSASIFGIIRFLIMGGV